ncbi:FKBP-type peptidyl-prolyl cis-trans isomerase SlyD [Methylohalomonas lacus]|uniref:Peptidyl-prolyl cis-trans isomerase n=1 Tax=Methylohalomonas lacus TaxID=398773 RepID=A0AAE3HHI2_9GAMM|nr:peptidylprolyl isomerase [Methylohalomonas lacus]MCS3902374.1 FKBP-type peptidyl-prolyl cis-trans isomerase SlyD [Methylohalomonas lacus]
MQVNENCAVSIHYTLSDEEGQQLDSSVGQEPLVYLHGANNIIPGLEQALTGKAEGEQVQVTVQPEEGFGEVNPELVQSVPREAFQGVDKVEPGMQFGVQGPEGQTQRVTVSEVHDDTVTIDGNHPLAGQVLHFDVTVEKVREASAEEIEQGMPGEQEEPGQAQA